MRLRGIQNLLIVAAVCLVFAGTGCRTHKTKARNFAALWSQGDLQGAVHVATEFAQKTYNDGKGKDAIVWQLEKGTAQRAAGLFQESNKAFALAEEKIDRHEEQAKVRVSSEAWAMISNQANVPYVGRSYDKIMLNTYKALNYLEMGESDRARTELFRAYQRQQDAVADNAKRIERAEEEIKAHKGKKSIERAQADPRFNAQIENAYGHLDALTAYEDYVNPYTVYLDGLFFMTSPADASDLERARRSFERVVGFTGGNPFVREDLEAVEGLANGVSMPPTTYVIFETGRAPIRGQTRIDIPIIVTDLSYVGMAFPKLEMQGNYISNLTITAGERRETTAVLASMDSIIGQDFKNELPVIITKTLISAAMKAAADYGINQSMRGQDGLAQLAVKLATAALQASVNIADTRTWYTLPKEIQFCRLSTPVDRRIHIAVSNGDRREVILEEGNVNLILVRAMSNASPLFVSQVKLN